MNQYKTFKDIPVDWIKTIPSHWQFKRVKEIGVLVLGKMLDNNPGDGKLRRHYLKSKNIGWLKVSDAEIEEMYFSTDEMKAYRLKKGDILLSEGGEVGKTAIWNEEIYECYIQNSVHKFTVHKKNHSRYFMYQSFALGHSGYYDSIVSQVSIKHLTKEKLLRVIWVCPPLEEQQAIADYLDAKTKQIDRKIELLEAKAERYADLKQSLINETVTRGLDRTVPMKDSGVEWIGQIPSHWEVKRVKDLFSERSQKGFPEEPLLIASQEKGVILKSDYSRNTMTVQQDFHLMKLVKKNDFVISLRSFEGGIEIANNQGIISAAYTILCATNDFAVGYYKHLFKSKRFISMLVTNTTGIREGRNVNYQQLKRELLPLPPLEECKAIAEYLEAKTTHIEKILETIHLEVESLKELRKTLINDVVTGKIKVYQGNVSAG